MPKKKKDLEGLSVKELEKELDKERDLITQHRKCAERIVEILARKRGRK